MNEQLIDRIAKLKAEVARSSSPSQGLARVEKQYRRLRTLFVTTVVLLTVAVCAIARDTPKSNEISTTRLVVTDADGRTRAEISTNASGPFLRLYDASGTARLVVSILKDMPNVTLANSKGLGVVNLAVQSYGSGLVLADNQGALRAQLDVGEDGPRLYLEDKKGFSATVGNFYFSDDPAKNKKSVAASIVLAQKDLGRIWSAP